MFQLNRRDQRFTQEERDMIDAAVKAGNVNVVELGSVGYVDKFQQKRDDARKERARLRVIEKKAEE